MCLLCLVFYTFSSAVYIISKNVSKRKARYVLISISCYFVCWFGFEQCLFCVFTVWWEQNKNCVYVFVLHFRLRTLHVRCSVGTFFRTSLVTLVAIDPKIHVFSKYVCMYVCIASIYLLYCCSNFLHCDGFVCAFYLPKQAVLLLSDLKHDNLWWQFQKAVD